MSSLRRTVAPAVVLIAALLVAACTASGPGLSNSLSSIFDQDLSARQPRQPGTPGSEQRPVNVASAAPRDQIFRGTGRDRGSGETISSFEPGEFTVNFENADIREVVQSILGNTLGQNYVIDPNVAGTVSVSSARKLTRDELLPVLEVILQMNGAALVRDGANYRVTLEASAVAGTADVGEAGPG
jgi:general secretion pathway protein D